LLTFRQLKRAQNKLSNTKTAHKQKMSQPQDDDPMSPNYVPPAKVSIDDLMKKDQEDESLRRFVHTSTFVIVELVFCLQVSRLVT